MGIFLLRIATQKKVRIVIWGIVIATVVATGYFFFQFLFQCAPISHFWNRPPISNGKGKCLDTKIIMNSAYAYSAITCAVDFCLCIVPIFMVSKLQLHRRTKLSVMAVLSLWCL